MARRHALRDQDRRDLRDGPGALHRGVLHLLDADRGDRVLLVFFGAGALAAAAIPAPRRIAHAIVAMELSASATLGLLGLVTWLCALAGWIQGDAFGRPLGRESTLNNTNGYLVMGAVALWLPIVWLFGLGGFTFGRLLTRRRRAVPPVVVVREMRA